jgi:hypothetical protein
VRALEFRRVGHPPLMIQRPSSGEDIVAAPPPGIQRFGRYEPFSKLAEGGMGAIHVAKQDSPQHTVTLASPTRPRSWARAAPAHGTDSRPTSGCRLAPSLFPIH